MNQIELESCKIACSFFIEDSVLFPVDLARLFELRNCAHMCNIEKHLRVQIGADMILPHVLQWTSITSSISNTKILLTKRDKFSLLTVIREQ